MDGYVDSNFQHRNVQPLTLAASAARTASGNGESVELGDRRVARLLLDVTAAAGTTPTLDVTVQGSKNNVDWYTLGAFAQKTSATSERKCVPCERFVRASWTPSSDVAGTNSAVAKETAPTVTIGGVPGADIDGVIEITTGGARGTAAFKWSDDGGATWEELGLGTSVNVALGSTGAGLLVSFGAGTYSVGERYTWTSEDAPADPGTITGPTVPTVGLTGEPAAAYVGVIEVDLEGVRGVATFRWSINGGSSWVAEDVATAATVALGATGLTATFASGTYALGRRYTWTSTAPATDHSFTFSVTGEAA